MKQIYKCPICGNIVEVLHIGIGELVCCGKPMVLLAENSTDGAQEKHVPIAEKTEGGLKIKIGSVPHPMEEAHYIEWIECLECGCKRFLKPGDAPEAIFGCCSQCGGKARAYCNLHGVWIN